MHDHHGAAHGALLLALQEGARELLFPSRANCMGCSSPLGADEGWLCAPCAELLISLSTSAAPCCPHCGRPFPHRGACSCAAWPRDGISFARCAYPYARPVDGMIRRMKYGGVHRMSSFLGTQLANLMISSRFDRPDALIPVPMHPRRLRDRGFNHAFSLAAALSDQVQIPVIDTMLARTRPTRQQARLSNKARHNNLAGAFFASGAEGLRLLLVDDVLTTGQTANQCAMALRAAGALDVQLIALAGANYENKST